MWIFYHVNSPQATSIGAAHILDIVHHFEAILKFKLLLIDIQLIEPVRHHVLFHVVAQTHRIILVFVEFLLIHDVRMSQVSDDEFF